MATEITIFDIPEKEIVATKNQTELEYEAMEKTSSFESYHFQNFYQMHLEHDLDQIPNSNITSILCKYVTQYATPLITRAETNKPFHIALQDDHSVLAKCVEDSSYYNIAAQEQYEIVGLILPEVFVRWYSSQCINPAQEISLYDVARSGKYAGYRDNITHQYTAQRPQLTHFGLPALYAEHDIRFTDDDSAKKLLITVIQFITHSNAFYQQNYRLLLLDLVSPPYITNSTFTPYELQSTSAVHPLELTPVEESLTQVLPYRISNTYEFAVRSVLQDYNLQYARQLGIHVGVGSELFKKAVAEQKAINDKNHEREQIAVRDTQNYLTIARKRAIAYANYKIDDLAQLTDKQKKVVELEFRRLEKALEKNTSVTVQNNKKLFYRLRCTFNDLDSQRLRDALAAIRKEIPAKQLRGNTLIDGGLCPHVFTRGEILYKHFGKPWLNTQLTKDLVQVYSLPADRDGYFCRICGEQLAESDTEGIVKFVGGEKVLLAQNEDVLYSLIWKEAMYVVSTYIKFNTPIPLKPLVNSIAQGLRGVISEHEARLMRSRTNSSDDIRDIINLHASIYIYAVLCAMMMNNPSKLQFGRENTLTKKGGDDNSEFGYSEYVNHQPQRISHITDERREARRKRVKARRATKTGGRAQQDLKKYERYILTTALNLIIITKNTLITRIKHLNTDVVKQIFLKTAYTWARQHSRPIKMSVKTDDDIDNMLTHIIRIDPTYAYIYYARRTAYNAGAIKQQPSSITDASRILGRTLKKVYEDQKQDINPYATVEAPAKWSFSNETYDAYTYGSFLMVMEYAKQGLFEKTIVPQHVQHQEYHKSFQYVRDLEKQVDRQVAISCLLPMYHVQGIYSMYRVLNNFEPSHIDIAQHYCPDGTPHRADALIYLDAQGKTVELHTRDIVQWLTDNNNTELAKFGKLRLVNERCGKCKALIRTAVSSVKNANALSDMFRHIDDVMAFYQYFETRCPEGDLHDIQNGKCSKCKMPTDLRKRAETDEGSAYYKKYISVYRKIEKEKRALTISSLAEMKQARDVSERVTAENPRVAYQYTLKHTAEWSQLTGVKYNAAVNIGLSEGLDYADIEKAVVNPSKTLDPQQDEGRFRTQAMRLLNYIYLVIRDYNMIRCHQHAAMIPLAYKKIIEPYKKPGWNKNLPLIARDFIQQNTRYRTSLNAVNYANFLMEYLSGIFLTLLKHTDKQYTPLMKELTKEFAAQIFTKERLFAKPRSIYAKLKEKDMRLDAFSESDSGTSGDEWTGVKQESSDTGDDVDHDYMDDIGGLDDAYDVERVDDIWDVE